MSPNNIRKYIENIEISEADASPTPIPVAQNEKAKKKTITYTKEEKDFSRQVLDYLEQKSGYHYGVNQENLKYIIARRKEGRTFEDMQHVIDFKCQEWLNDEKMTGYLRPNTLFRPTNFDNYLAQWSRSQRQYGGYYSDEYYYGS